MSFSYTAGSTAPLDLVRLYIGDTIKDPPALQQLQDEEIQVYLSLYPGNPLQAAAKVCVALAARYSRDVDKSLGQLSVSASQRRDHYMDLASALSEQALSADGLGMRVGGITVAQHVRAGQNPGATQPAYRRGQNDFPGNGDNILRANQDPKFGGQGGT